MAPFPTPLVWIAAGLAGSIVLGVLLLVLWEVVTFGDDDEDPLPTEKPEEDEW